MFAVIDLEQNCWHCVRVLFPGHARRVCYTTGSFQQQVTAIDEKRSGFCYSARSYIIICRRYLLLFFIHTVIMHMHSNVRVRMVCVHRTKGYPGKGHRADHSPNYFYGLHRCFFFIVLLHFSDQNVMYVKRSMFCVGCLSKVITKNIIYSCTYFRKNQLFR
jgi:hypothetical protein